MNRPIYNRYERKYIITAKQKDDLLLFLKEYLVDDPYSLSGKPYTVYNIYFDTHDFNIIRNSISKPRYKDKLRLRSYKFPLNPEDQVFLEIKKKYEGRINKRRVAMTYNEAILYLEKQVQPQFSGFHEKQIMKEIDYFINIHKAYPGAFIRYDRIAMVSPTDELRVTFDHNIQFRNQKVNFTNDYGNLILSDTDSWLMEVKTENNFPFWLARKLSEYQLYSQSFSKYGRAYQQYLLGGTNDDYILYRY